MRRSTLLLGAVVFLMTGQSRSDSECGLARDDIKQDLEKHIIACNYRDNHAFLRSLPFGVNNLSVSLKRDSAECFYLACCNKILKRLFPKIFLPGPDVNACTRINCEGVTKIGAEIDGKWRCKADGQVISNDTARCDTFETDGSGWNLVRADNNNSLCLKCESGSYLADAVCKLCQKGNYSDVEGATECKTCLQGNYSDVEGATECKTCLQGNYSDVEGATECKTCLQGNYSDVEGATECKTCLQGNYSDVEGATECKTCLQGNYSDVEGATECKTCLQGNYSDVEGATECKTCPKGNYSDVEGATECKPCPRGRYTEGKGASECLYCPAGHTTYTHTPNTCVGPQLEGLDRKKRNAVFSVRVSYDTLGNQERKAVYWKSVGDWNLLNRYKRKFAKITQKYTTSYRRGPRVIRKSPVTTAVRQIIKDVYCYSGSGEKYAGYENKSKFGGVCRGPSEHCTTMNRERVCYCRNKATGSHSKPYCEGQDGAEEYCDVPKCNDQERSVHQVTRCGYEKNTHVSSIESVSSSIGFADNDSARKVCDKLGGECKGVWGKGNSWRVTGLSPTEQGTGSYEYYRKDPHCPNPYHQYYFQQE
ncbi:uncharacterized protein LOC134820793 isoform X2 [Bolinopsis microptera]|uniref:uncharacterized protein LOC134820793 isoform X2 n=1 Tax=Bolinopsis microptera TaxID=2820187 RepID=UPI00307A7A22